MPVFLSGRIFVVFGQKERLLTQIVPADGRELRIGVAGRQHGVEPVAGYAAVGKIGQIRIPVNDVEYEIQFALFQIHKKIQMCLAEELKFDRGIMEIEFFDQGTGQREGLSLHISDVQRA